MKKTKLQRHTPKPAEKAYIPDKKQKKVTGTLRGNRKGFAFLTPDDGGDDIFIPNRALKGAQHKDKVEAVIVSGDEGKVTDILERNADLIVGTLQRDAKHAFIIPDGKHHIDDLYVAPHNVKKVKNNTKVLARIVSYKGKNPEAEIAEVLGPVGDINTTVLAILKGQGFTDKFPSSVLKEASEAAEKYKDPGKRRDLKDLLTVTIDGDDSKDFDDAVSLFKNGDGYELYVHIADVTNYVRAGSKLDKQALWRGTSVYFPGSVFPMLPEELSNGICSLNPDEERLALTVKINLNKAGEVTKSEIFESIIKSDYRMTYKNVTAILDGDKELIASYGMAVPMLQLMLELRNKLYKIREARGAISFETKEAKILVKENGEVEDIKAYEYTVSNSIIEEFMVLTNSVVAEKYFKLKAPFVYRVHEKPVQDKVSDFAMFAKGLGLQFDGSDLSPMNFEKLLREVKDTPLDTIVSKVMLRSMQKAAYDTNCEGHFGLALTYYCHFTSPIRRYPDLMIHRIIKTQLAGRLTGEVKDRLASEAEAAADISSERERAAELAERDIDDYYKAEFMKRHIGEEFEGTVSGVMSFGIFVELDNTCEGLVKIEDLPEDEYEFVAERFVLEGREHSYTLGQKIRIVVAGAYPEDKRVDFLLKEADEK